MMQLRDIFVCAPLRDKLTTAKTACGRITRSNCHDTHVRARGAQQGRGLRILLSHILILLSCFLALTFCGRISGATTTTATTITSPAPRSTLTSASTTFTWNAGPAGTTGYGLNVGTSLGGANLVNIYPLSGTSTTVNLPTNGATIYVRLWTVLNGTTYLSRDFTYTEFMQSASAITSPVPGSMLTSAATTFTWNAGPAGTTGYGLNVGTSPGGANLVNVYPLSGTSATVNLPTNGATIYVRLWTVLNGTTYLYNDYTYSAASSSPILSGLSCASASMTAAGTDSCTVTLNAAAPSGGLAVSLASNNTAVVVPASVTVAAGATTTSFAAAVSSVSTVQTVTLTASANSVAKTLVLQLGTSVITLSVSSSSLTFGSINVNTAATQTMTLSSTGTAAVTVSAATITGSGFTVSGGSFPLTLNPNQTATLAVQFDPTAAGAVSGSLMLTSNSSSGTSTVVSLSGTGVPVLSGLTCTSGSVTGAGTDSCTVTLNAAAPSGGFAFSLASNNAAVVVPASVTVAAGATTASFTATVSSVSTAQTVTLTASANSVATTFALQLGTATAMLSTNTTTIAFGTVNLNSPATQTLILTSTGSAPVTISAAAVTGSGFTVSGGSFPMTLNPNQSATLSTQFDPSVAGAATGQLSITSNCSMGSSMGVSLSGTGAAVPYEVNLAWDAPTSSPDPVAGYNVYRAPSGSTNYQQLNSAAVTETTYVDTTVLNSQTYDYIVESVDASGVTSSPSNMAAIPVP
jgi:hypothetical protein